MAMCEDMYTIRREIRSIKRSNIESSFDEKVKERLFRLEKKLQASIKKRSWRKENLPDLTFNTTLPITSKKDEIIDAISKNQVVIISGETGSGKTTQIPKFCLAAGRGIDGKIGCTQPRRIAATTVANRIAEELGEEIGGSVGYKIRFKDRTRKDSFVKIMTDGILLAEAQNDPFLNTYDTIIVDEAHERSLNIDFVLGILKTLLKKRKDLKLVITSATIDTEKFSNAFGNAPVIEVSGRMYPVDVRYLPVDHGPEENGEQTHVEAAVSAVDKLQIENPFGDILVFMPTEQDIRETCELLEGRGFKGVTVLPLYARLSAAEQSRIFSRPPGRKIIVATNVAETSITIPGIKYVIDTGLARISRYTPRSRTTSLPVTPISRSSADQRKGRCGRVENGVCIRLFSEKEFLSRPLFTPPEILRSNLAEVILRMIDLKLGDISDFPFIDRPLPKSIKDGFNLLSELGAIASKPDKKKSKEKNRFFLTEKGRLMAKMPVDPRLSRMLIQAQKEGCIKEVAVIASALSIQDPRERPTEKTKEADQIHATFNDSSSDFITLLNIWNRYHETWQTVRSTNRMKRFCKEHYLSFKRMREWQDIHTQILDILKEHGLSDSHLEFPVGQDKVFEAATKQKKNSGSDTYSPLYSAIHKSILSGFLSNIAVKKEKNIFKAAKGREVMIFPGSTLFNKSGTWIVAAEMLETSRLFARTTANIDDSWLEELGKDQCKYTYLQPHWERKRGEVVAFEQVSLFGLIIIPMRPVSYGRINPDEASDIFIRSALIEGDVKKPFDFMKYNKSLINDIMDMENRIRRRDLLVSEHEILEFYKEKLAGIYDIRTLEKLIKKNGSDRFLWMSKSDLLLCSPDEEELSLFPNSIAIGNKSFKCSYNFSPGKQDDGVTIKIPSAVASTVPSESMDWLVPGLFMEKIKVLIKALPKAYRKKLVPVARTADIIANEMHKGEKSLITELSNFIYKRFGVDIPASAWPFDALPDYLKMRISLTGPKGEELCSGREKAVLSRNVSSKAEQKDFEAARKNWERTGITRWDFEDLSDTVTIKGRNNAKWNVYPGLERGERCVNLRLFRRRDPAIRSHKKGVAALFALHFSNDLKFLKKNLVLPKEMEDKTNYFGGPRLFKERLYESVTNDLFCRNIRTKNEFYFHAESVSSNILTTGQKKLNSVMAVLEAFHESRSTLYKLETASSTNTGVLNFFVNLREELSKLVPETFMDLYDTERLIHLPRYIKAMAIRAQRGLVNFEKEQNRTKEIKVYTDSLNELLKKLSPSVTQEKRNAIEEYFWLIEEYKVSVFAQELKTPFPVSKKRLDKKLKEIERMV